MRSSCHQSEEKARACNRWTLRATRTLGSVVVVAESSGDTTELRCGECGYGIMVSVEPPACPMCRAFAWETSDVGGDRTSGPIAR